MQWEICSVGRGGPQAIVDKVAASLTEITTFEQTHEREAELGRVTQAGRGRSHCDKGLCACAHAQ